MEPRTEGSGRLVEDGIGCGGNMSRAELTAIDLPTLDAEVLGDALALGTGYALRPSGVLDELKAGVFIGELGIELFDGVLFHGSIVA